MHAWLSAPKVCLGLAPYVRHATAFAKLALALLPTALLVKLAI